MKILLAYSSKTKNTKKVAEAIYEEIKNLADVNFINIKKQKVKLQENYDLYILGAWTDKTNANKNMQNFIDTQEIKNKNVALFLTCGVPREHYHADDSINNYIKFMKERNNKILKTFVCQGKIDPKILIVFKVLSWKDPNFIHKVTPDLVEMVKESKSHPDAKDLADAKKCFREFLNLQIKKS
ncbi:flavodoxin family protein [Gemella cuniculi]|uniref:flavodoxin family protein n=1 Tax=Gemella cuniculi TaxID=150240 RepID=UPI0004202BF0|nr:flavodoxin family protein [Gemella cuniculi]